MKKVFILTFTFMLFFSSCTAAVFYSNVQIENSSGLNIKLQLDKESSMDITPSTKTFKVSFFSTPKNCTIYMDSERYVTYKISKNYFWSQPRFSLYKDSEGNYLSVVNGEVSETDEFVRFGDGTNGIRVKFVSSSSGMPPSSDQTLSIQTADKSDTVHK